jgi:hypothetical protein
MVSLDRQMEAGWLYGLVTFAGFIIGGWVWARRFRSTPESFSIFVGAIIGAYSGAKILFLLAEWENVFSDLNWLYLAASGKTIVGALLGGYAGVEIAKARAHSTDRPAQLHAFLDAVEGLQQDFLQLQLLGPFLLLEDVEDLFFGLVEQIIGSHRLVIRVAQNLGAG